MLQFPRTELEWKSISKQFEERWNFPHCLGAIDGKHIDITPPANSGSYYFNYKGKHSLVLMAIVDANYQFLLCDFGTNGRISDGGVLQNTEFYEKLQNNDLKIPLAESVGNISRSLPYVFVADDAFPLRCDMIKPFRQIDLNSHERKIYNYRVSRARRIVENAFGILASRFRIFHTQINIDPHRIESVVMASCALHNFLMSTSHNFYAPSECYDHEDRENGTVTSGLNTTQSNMNHLHRRNYGNITNAAKIIRQEFINYFNNEGSVPWQNDFVS